jgi:ammonia channel protein AmtB
MELAINLILFLLSAYWCQQGVMVYSFWNKNQPGSGFIPVIFSAILMVFSFTLLFKEIRRICKNRSQDARQATRLSLSDLRPLLPVGYTIAAIVLFRFTGVVVSMFLTAFIWLAFIGKVRIAKSLVISVILTLMVYLIFVVWLRIPFPRSIFGF